MILNEVMAVTLRYLTEFGKPAFQRITADIYVAEYMQESILFCSACTMSS